jgi:hypothetical protein
VLAVDSRVRGADLNTASKTLFNCNVQMIKKTSETSVQLAQVMPLKYETMLFSAQYDGGADEHVGFLRFVHENFPSVPKRPPGPNQQSLKGLSGLVKSVGLIDFLFTHGARRLIDTS